jgi:HAD superfamily hydrolase (TIGR01509 family)
VIRAVVFDLDGVLLDSEQVWDEARRDVVARHGGRWRPEASSAMQGMSSREWAHYLHDDLGLDLPEHRIVDGVVEGVLGAYAEGLPLLPGAVDSVRRLGRRWPLGLASSANRVVIEEVLATAGLAEEFAVTVSSEEVDRGKPAPDVYLEAARRLRAPPALCVAVEDSANGIRSAVAAGLQVVAIPNRHDPPPDDVLARARLVVDELGQLTPEALVAAVDTDGPTESHLDEAEIESFPASDPHADWAGPGR